MRRRNNHPFTRHFKQLKDTTYYNDNNEDINNNSNRFDKNEIVIIMAMVGMI